MLWHPAAGFKKNYSIVQLTNVPQTTTEVLTRLGKQKVNCRIGSNILFSIYQEHSKAEESSKNLFLQCRSVLIKTVNESISFARDMSILVMNKFHTNPCDFTKIYSIYLLCGRKLGPDPWSSSGVSFSLPDFSWSPAAGRLGNSCWK